jgi:NADPH:quinone reductase-like Zn-dependent oxidoreductase
MKAAQFGEYGDPAVMVVHDIERPLVEPGKILVEVHASSLNPFDSKLRQGYMKEAMPLQLPVTLGGDIAGIVREVGDDVSGFNEGDAVYGQANVVAGNSGAFAEFAVTSAGQIAKAPKDLDFNQLASLPLVGISAWQAIVRHIKLASGQKILIHGGAGGIGTMSIQIAKHLGAYVATTATGDGMSYVKELGADEVIDYKAQDFVAAIQGYDAVFDLVGGADFNRALDVLKEGGVAVSMIAAADEHKTKDLSITAITQSTHVTTEALNELTKLVENKVITPHVDKVFSLDQIKEAFEARETGSIRGKIVIQIQ